ncbi:MAG: hypothetical protein KDC34_09385 [Saprospiraceae bacterium]|nr:hypothetical protein [Saprospiraceae bacterium]
MKYSIIKAASPILFVLGSLLIQSGCYYDNAQDLYQYVQVSCDTTDITYSGAVLQVLDNYCLICHNGADQQGNVNLEGYTNVALYSENGKLYGSVSHQSSYFPMPPTGQQIPECDQLILKTWIDAGWPEN